MHTPALILPESVVAGSVDDAALATPVPPSAIATAQLRAINHRLLQGAPDPGGHQLEALTAEDFLFTADDGTWHDRAGFLAEVKRRPPIVDVSCEDLRVRLFGPVAVVHGVFGTSRGVTSKVRATDVHVWSGALWRLVSAQDTLLQPGVTIAPRTASAPAPAPWHGRDPSGDDLAVLRLLNAHYVQAFREADVAWYDAHLAPDYVVVSGDGTFEDRGAALVDFALPYFATSMAAFPVGKVNIRRFHDVALVHAENDYQRKDGRTGVNRYTDIWHKHDGRWRCIAAHITVHKAPAW
jgi:ketosteroid isomerase-like protein